jgi:hypothetical protein
MLISLFVLWCAGRAPKKNWIFRLDCTFSMCDNRRGGITNDSRLEMVSKSNRSVCLPQRGPIPFEGDRPIQRRFHGGWWKFINLILVPTPVPSKANSIIFRLLWPLFVFFFTFFMHLPFLYDICSHRTRFLQLTLNLQANVRILGKIIISLREDWQMWILVKWFYKSFPVVNTGINDYLNDVVY